MIFKCLKPLVLFVLARKRTNGFKTRPYMSNERSEIANVRSIAKQYKKSKKDTPGT